MNVKLIINKIKKQRKLRGYSHEQMAFQLNISQAAYTKIENNDTKLTVQRLIEIAKVLEIEVISLFEKEDVSLYKDHGSTNNNFEEITNVYKENLIKTKKIEELYEQILIEKQSIIEILKTNPKS